MKKLISLVLALAMILVVSAVFADGDTGTSNGTITITPPAGIDVAATNVYKVYKVFDAVYGGENAISYTLKSGKTTVPDVSAYTNSFDAATTPHFILDNQGNVHYGTIADGVITNVTGELSPEAIKAIAAYVTEDDLVTTAESTGTKNATATVPLDGYYYIGTTTGTTVTITSTRPHDIVNDKNTVPTVDKTITGASSVDEDGKKALAQAGTIVTYQAVITVGKGAINYAFHDTMETGLTYNEDVAVTGVESDNYTVGQAEGDTFTITFKDDYIKTLNEGDKITITYSATVNEDAITTDPLNNTAYVSYGDSSSNYRTPNTETVVYDAKFTVNKKDGAGQPLAGAGFVIKNTDNKYYKITNKIVSWVASIEDATEYTSGTDGAVPSFTGLANGTYTLIEKTIPEGYNKAADSTFTVAEHNYTTENLEQEAEVTNNAGTELPSTGGIGTTIFYVIGGILLVGAAIVLVARRKAND